MARVTEQGLSGAVGNLVFYTVNGVNYVRSKPGKRRKKRGQPANPLNTVFGTVSKYGSAMVKRMDNSFLFPFGRTTYNATRGWMRNEYAAHQNDLHWEPEAKRNRMCQLNPEADLRDFLEADITVTNDSNGIVQVHIPEMKPAKDLKAPAGTLQANLKIIVLTSPFGDTGHEHYFEVQQHSFPYNASPVAGKKLSFNTGSNAGSVALVVIAIEYQLRNSAAGLYSTDPCWLPAAIVAMGRLKK